MSVLFRSLALLKTWQLCPSSWASCHQASSAPEFPLPTSLLAELALLPGTSLNNPPDHLDQPVYNEVSTPGGVIINVEDD